MYLTDEEFKVLLGIKEGLSYGEIYHKYGVYMGMNDPRINSLLRKYCPEFTPYYRTFLRQNVDLSKVKVVSKNEMPYFKYIENQLADYIDINKRDVEQLVEYFKNLSNEPWAPTHRLYRTDDGLSSAFYIQDLKTGKRSKLRINIDGDDYVGDELKELDNENPYKNQQ